MFKTNQELKSIIERVKNQYGLDQYQANRAIIQAPIGQKHFDEGIKLLMGSNAVRELAAKGEILVLIITNKETQTGITPSWIKCVLVDNVPSWPKSPVYQNRFFKWAIPFLFPNIKTSLYLDSDLIITKTPSKLEHVFEYTESVGFLNTKHNVRAKFQDEYRAILKHRVSSKWKLRLQHLCYRMLGLPTSTKVYQNNFIGRWHASEHNILCLEVLKQMAMFTERDQMALPYACFKNKRFPHAAEEGVFLWPFKNNAAKNLETVVFVDNLTWQFCQPEEV